MTLYHIYFNSSVNGKVYATIGKEDKEIDMEGDHLTVATDDIIALVTKFEPFGINKIMLAGEVKLADDIAISPRTIIEEEETNGGETAINDQPV